MDSTEVATADSATLTTVAFWFRSTMTWAEVACPSGIISSSMTVSGSIRLSSMQHQHPILQAATQLQMQTPKTKNLYCFSNKNWNSGYSKWSYQEEKHLQQSTFPRVTNCSSRMTKLIHKQSSSLHIMIDIFQLNSQFTIWRIQIPSTLQKLTKVEWAM